MHKISFLISLFGTWLMGIGSFGIGIRVTRFGLRMIRRWPAVTLAVQRKPENG